MNNFVSKPVYDMNQDLWLVIVDTGYDSYFLNYEEFGEAYSLYLKARRMK